MPGGLQDVGEGLDEAVCREVLEETGVPVVFKSVLSFRHTHNSQFGRDDLYFVCRVEVKDKDKLKDGVLPDTTPQEGEISEVKWVPLSDYKNMVKPDGENPHPVMQRVLEVVEGGGEGEGDIQMEVIESVVPGREPSPIYYPPIRKNN